jgi:DNA-3-methyladenine glycosylase II
MRKAILHLKTSDPVLSQLIEKVGPYRIQYRPPEFSTLVRSIVYQQVSGKAAATIIGRLEAVAPGLKPSSIVRLSDEELRAVGLSVQKRTYIRDLAEKTLARRIRFPSLGSLSDDEVIQRLTQVKGIGVWTAHMFLMFALRRPDVLPVGDLGVRAAIKRAYQMEALPTPADVLRVAQPWRPWASVASWYLWRSLEGPAELK